MRIAYIEDNPSNIALVERICRMNQDELVTFDDPQLALSTIGPRSMDLILMDIDLGAAAYNGLELTRLLRDKGVKDPIVIVTSYDAVNYPGQYEVAGFDEYILKPVSVRGMIDLINAYRPS